MSVALRLIAMSRARRLRCIFGQVRAHSASRGPARMKVRRAPEANVPFPSTTGDATD